MNCLKNLDTIKNKHDRRFRKFVLKKRARILLLVGLVCLPLSECSNGASVRARAFLNRKMTATDRKKNRALTWGFFGSTDR